MIRRLRLYLRLGRVSNLPTVWTNTLAGALLSGGQAAAGTLLLLVGAMSAFYVAGMFLNDVFDREIDARERPDRPIPSGQIRTSEVLGIGLGLLLVGIGTVAAAGSSRATFASLGLAVTIVVYDLWHKRNPVAPFLMGACRAWIYLTTALAFSGALAPRVWAMALGLAAWVVGLSFAARHEALGVVRARLPHALFFAPLWAVFAVGPTSWTVWTVLFAAAVVGWAGLALRTLASGKPFAVPAGIQRLIAGISLLDAAFLASGGEERAAVLALLGLPLTLLLQRKVPGT